MSSASLTSGVNAPDAHDMPPGEAKDSLSGEPPISCLIRWCLSIELWGFAPLKEKRCACGGESIGAGIRSVSLVELVDEHSLGNSSPCFRLAERRHGDNGRPWEAARSHSIGLACPDSAIFQSFSCENKNISTIQQSTNALSVRLSSTAVEESKKGEIFS